MQTVAIIGAGDIGATIARSLAAARVAARVQLIDAAHDVARGKALDIEQACPVEGSGTRVHGAAEVDAVRGATTIVVADRAGADGEWQGEPGLLMLRRVVSIEPAAPIVLAGARQLGLLKLLLTEAGVPRTRVLGSAPDALRAAARSMVALTANAAATDVCLSLAGTPPHWVFGWSAATLAGQPFGSRMSAAMRAQVERRALGCWPPGPYALGSAAALAVRTLLSGSPRELTAFVGIDARPQAALAVLALPVRLHRRGVAAVHEPDLSPRERVELQASLAG